MTKIMLFMCLILLIPKSSVGVDIIQSPDEHVWVEQGKDKSLVCETNQRWQWCFWEHTNVNLQKVKYQTVQEYITLETGDPQIKFTKLSKTTCGIKIADANPLAHQVTNKAPTTNLLNTHVDI